MKTISFLVFLGIVLAIHFTVNYYIYQRGLQALEGAQWLKTGFKWSMLVLLLAYPLGRLFERLWYSPISVTIHWIGAFWFAGMLYFVMSLFLLDLVRLFNVIFHFLPAPGSSKYLTLKLYTMAITVGIVVLVVIGGHINAWHPRISRYQIDLDKNVSGRKELKIVAASDIHLGSIIGPRKTAKLVNEINRLNPDIILLSGDVVDEDVGPVIRQNLGDSLSRLDAPLGVYGITGNHEYIGGVDRATAYLEEHGITMLRDTVVLVDSSFYLVGREDKDKLRFTGFFRKEVAGLVNNLDNGRPIIVLDHQPFDLDKPEMANVDLQISGHTHHGQLWPLGYITNKLYEVSRGYKKKGDTHIIVSTGFGTWGPPVRTGNRPEILDITLRFKGNHKAKR
ncbi:metallophosphoesterase [Marinilabiliaceae bacterium JC017]|nr:metallophosphoesterase [Marinilabiliaceae bacterium JC017]